MPPASNLRGLPSRQPKLALYPLTADDLLVSVPLFQTILTALEHGTVEERQALASRLREMWASPYA